MLLNNILNKIISVILIVFIFPTISVFGISSQEKKRNELKKNGEILKQDIDETREDTNRFKSDANKFNGQIDQKNNQIFYKKNEIDTLKKRAKESTEKIENLNKKISFDFEKLKQRITSIYKTQELGFVDFVFGSETFDEFFERLTLVKNVVDHDMELIEKLKNNIESLEQEKKDLNSEKLKINNLIKNLKEETGELCELKQDSEVQTQKSIEKEKKLEEAFLQNETEIKKVDDEISSYFKLQAAKMQKQQILDDNVSCSSENSGDKTSFFDNQENNNQEGNNSNFSNDVKKGGSSNDCYGWPVPGFDYISTHYGRDVLYGRERFHKGIDIAGSGIYGKPVVAIADGEIAIVYSGCSHDEGGCSCGGGFGNNIVVNHGERKGFIAGSRYGHLSSVCVSVNQRVKKGQIIGYVGSTGYSTGPHLHFEVWKNGEQYDPMEEY